MQKKGEKFPLKISKIFPLKPFDHQDLFYTRQALPFRKKKKIQRSIISDCAAADAPIKFSPLRLEPFLTSPPVELICLQVHKSASRRRGGKTLWY